jgi:hypothetical protein
VEGWITNIGTLMDFFVSGAEIVVIDCASLNSKFLNECCKITENIALKTDCKNLAQAYEIGKQAGIENIVCTINDYDFQIPIRTMRLFADISALSDCTRFIECYENSIEGFIISLDDL